MQCVRKLINGETHSKTHWSSFNQNNKNLCLIYICKKKKIIMMKLNKNRNNKAQKSYNTLKVSISPSVKAVFSNPGLTTPHVVTWNLNGVTFSNNYYSFKIILILFLLTHVHKLDLFSPLTSRLFASIWPHLAVQCMTFPYLSFCEPVT